MLKVLGFKKCFFEHLVSPTLERNSFFPMWEFLLQILKSFH
ncbi:hypothetical protein GCL57_03790 [Fluviispira multicolorata]|uniref:Uncharacterized protein n=1 Tax=Fluviispira multicolorata TaxID=2654512 RepID=A0A833JGY6_9BACT|nr:hypothetical protein GCL57_03790 [Fluviispira multicolorata]